VRIPSSPAARSPDPAADLQLISEHSAGPGRCWICGATPRPNGQQPFVYEGLWHNAVRAKIASILSPLIPASGLLQRGENRAAQIPARATQAYRVSEKTFTRMSKRDRPGGLLSVTTFLVADGLAIPGALSACGFGR